MLASTRMHSGVPHATLNVCPLPSLSLRLPALPPHPSPPGCLWFRRDWHTATGIRDIVGFIYFVQFFWGLLPMLATVITFQQVPGRHYYLRRQTGARGGRGGGGVVGNRLVWWQAGKWGLENHGRVVSAVWHLGSE